MLGEMRRVAVLGIAAVLVVAFTVLWVVPVVAGPTIDCGPFDEATCERIVADIIARHDHPAEGSPDWIRRPAYLPVTSVVLRGAGDYEINWLFGGFGVYTD
jgi:hypothetical protein